VCCTHEYTLSNLKFARAVEPGNLELINYTTRGEELRARDLPTLPSTIGQEKRINPFLRSRLPGVSQVVRAHDAASPDDVGVFAPLRKWKNEFR
jgi:hydroxyacylglutathione hydrolase